MNKAFYIVGIVFSVIFLIITGYYSEEVSSAKWSSFYSNMYDYDYLDYGYSSYDSSYEYKDLTVAAALWSLFFFLCFIAIDLLGMIKIKTKTTKVLSIIGLSFSGIFLLWNFAVMASPGSLSFDEVSPAWGFYCMLMLAFTIVGLVQSARYNRIKVSGGSVTQNNNTEDLLDS
jgi:hypothetical protein